MQYPKGRLDLVLAAVLWMGAMAAAVPAHAANLAGAVHAGYARLLENGGPDGSFALRGNGFAIIHPVLHPGLELGWSRLGKIGYSDLSAIHGAAVVRARASSGSLRPYSVGGIGPYVERVSSGGSARTEAYFGFSLGGGLALLPAGSRTGYALEARWHHIVADPADNLLTVSVGFEFD